MNQPTTRSDKILVVDDDSRIRDLLRRYLSQEGFEVFQAEDGKALSRILLRETVDLIVLDLMLPGVDGMEVARRIREASKVPILMLTARGAVADRVRGLAGGADDYLAKPFSPAELVARVQAILRRVEPELADGLLRHADLEIDTARHEVRRGGADLTLSSLEFRLLSAIVGARGRVLSRDQLMETVTGFDADGVLERSVDVYIFRLRQKLGDAAESPRYIQTVRGVGYRTPAG